MGDIELVLKNAKLKRLAMQVGNRNYPDKFTYHIYYLYVFQLFCNYKFF